MAKETFQVSISPREARDLIENEILQRNISGTLVDSYVRQVGEYEMHVLILEKYYMRSSNRASVTSTIDNFDGVTTVHVVAAGSSEGVFFRFDWGAGSDFANSVARALAPHRIGGEDRFDF
ncbi:hypothetical protein HNO89_002322 [Sporosarcina luteola]|nr:hypothetical protein [Sporosarcina luteola]